MYVKCQCHSLDGSSSAWKENEEDRAKIDGTTKPPSPSSSHSLRQKQSPASSCSSPKMEECHGDVASATNPTQPNPHPAFFFCPPTEKSRSTDRHEHECALARMREGKGRAEARREESLRAWCRRGGHFCREGVIPPCTSLGALRILGIASYD
jgi:hypothetical protein